ncbi:MAG TPA: SAM-dependent methyltransferase [Methylomirabilota bacterium]|nr:SAM-dependent methyltransferase [Methylomirabilota bacterium]
MSTPLAARIKAIVAATGPMSVSDYMALCLGDPTHGYYTTRDPFGASGDFVTAPEISQMFGELVGVWSLAAYAAMGSPAAFNLVEIGPGRGTLMADLLRAARVRPAFLDAATVHLVETSPTLREIQVRRLAAHQPLWHEGVDTLPDGPSIVIANEFFDALPIRQLVRTADGWRERVIGLDADGNLAFGAGAAGVAPDLAPPHAAGPPVGAIVEVNRAAEAIMATLASRIAATGGALITFDYGSSRRGTGDTLQAVRAHRVVDALASPGEADLTAHVDFAALAGVARAAGARVFGPRAQGHVLLDLGLLERAGMLGRDADEAGRAAIAADVARLAGEDGMGRLFQALAVTSGFAAPGFGSDGGLAR